MIKQEIEADGLDNNNNLDEDKINPYHEIIANIVEKEIQSHHKCDNSEYLVT